MKSVGILIALLASASAFAQSYTDMGRVVQVAPQVQRFNQPQQVCSQAPAQYYPAQPAPHGNGGAVLGAITGGLLGNTVGRGQGKIAAVGIGAATGAIVGDRMQNGNGQPAPGYVVGGGQSCYMVDNWIERQTGAVIVYEYQGKTFTQTLAYVPNYRPGDMVPITLHASLN